MAARLIQFDIESLRNLLVHYADSELPLNAEVKQVQASQFLPRWISLIVESDSWEGTPFAGEGYGSVQPYVFRYEGKRTLNLNNLKDAPVWGEQGYIEAPKRQ